MKMKNFTPLAAILPLTIIALLISSCSKEEVIEPIIPLDIIYDEACQDLAYLDTIYSLESSRAFIPYPDDVTKVIFSDASGQEFEGIVTYYDEGYNAAVNGTENPCPLDSNIQITYRWHLYQKSMTLDFPELQIEIRLNVSPSIDRENYLDKLTADYFRFVMYKGADQKKLNSQMSIVVDPKDREMPPDSHSDFKEEFTIHNTVYQDVYINAIENEEEFELFYNGAFGILGFRNADASIDLKYVRFE